MKGGIFFTHNFLFTCILLAIYCYFKPTCLFSDNFSPTGIKEINKLHYHMKVLVELFQNQFQIVYLMRVTYVMPIFGSRE